MRSIAALLLIGCRAGYTIPRDRLADYAADKPVPTRDGAVVSLADGGDLRLLPAEGTCLAEVQAGPRADGGRRSVVKTVAGGSCADQTVRRVHRVRVGPLIEVEGANETITAESDAVAGVELRGLRLPEMRERVTKMRSPGTVYAGLPILLVGVGAGVGLIVAGVTHDSQGFFDLTGFGMTVGGAGVLVSNVVAGVVMIAVGAQPVPRAAPGQARLLPSGTGFEW